MDVESENVEVRFSDDGKKLWINVDGRCVLRAVSPQKIAVRNDMQNVSVKPRDPVSILGTGTRERARVASVS